MKLNANGENDESKEEDNAKAKNTENTTNEEIWESRRRDFVVELRTFLIYPLHLQHRISNKKLESLGSLTHSYPVIAIALVSGILSFLSSSIGNSYTKEPEQLPTNVTSVVVVNGLNYTLVSLGGDKQDLAFEFISHKTRDAFIVTIGVLSLVQIAIQKIGQHYNFAARLQIEKYPQRKISIVETPNNNKNEKNCVDLIFGEKWSNEK